MSVESTMSVLIVPLDSNDLFSAIDNTDIAEEEEEEEEVVVDVDDLNIEKNG
jgi:hypothetical protein